MVDLAGGRDGLRRGGWHYPLAIALAGVIGAAVYFLCRGRGYFADEGSFCTIAQGILRGELPYRDLFNEKPPLQYVWTAAMMALSAPTLAGARLAAIVSLSLTALCILSGPAARSRHPLWLFGWAAFLFLAATDMAAFNDTAESSLALLFSLSALIVSQPELVEERERLVMAALLGALFGVAMGFRQTAAVPALVMLFLPQAKLPKLAFGVGVSAGLLCWLVPVFALGIGQDFTRSVVTFHVGNSLAASYFHRPFSQDLPSIALWVLCLVWLGNLKEYREQRLWLLAFVIAMALPFFGRMDAFRLWPSTAAMLVLIARVSSFEDVGARVCGIVATGIALVAIFVSFPQSNPDLVASTKAIAAMTRPSDRIWVGAFSPESYCLTQREPASRYYFILPWTAKDEVRRQIVADIETVPSKLVVVQGGPYKAWRLLPELQGLLARDYRFAGSFGGAAFYLRKTDIASPSTVRPYP
jgi:hypothetical protein